MHYRIEPVIYANGMSRRNVLFSDAVDQLIKTAKRYSGVPMLLIIPRIITLGLSADDFVVVMILLKMINERMCIEVADNYGMDLVSMAREYEILCTNPLSKDTSSHVRPLHSHTYTPEQAAIKDSASSKIKSWMNDGISPDEKQYIIDGCQLGSSTKDIDKSELRLKVLSIIHELASLPSDDVNQFLEMTKTIVKHELGDLLSCSNKKTCNVIALRSSPNGSAKNSRRVEFGSADIEDDTDVIDDVDDYDNKEVDVGKEDAYDELSLEDIDLPIDLHINLPMQQYARTTAALELTDTVTKRPLHILNGICESRRQVSGVFLEVIYVLLNNNVKYLCVDQTTRLSNGLPKMALVQAICDLLGIVPIVASQNDVSPLLIAASDQRRILHMKAKLMSFHAKNITTLK
jgi:hypothetical protein